LIGSTAHPATKLMKLGKSEAFSTFDDHYGGITYVHTHLNNCGSHHDMGTPCQEVSHGGFFFFRFHLSMNHTHLVVRQREGAGNTFKSIFKIFVIHGL